MLKTILICFIPFQLILRPTNSSKWNIHSAAPNNEDVEEKHAFIDTQSSVRVLSVWLFKQFCL